MEPIVGLVRPIDMGEESEALRRFDEHAADQCRYWGTLRDSGLLTPDQEGEILLREVRRLASDKPAPSRSRECDPDVWSGSSNEEKE